MTGGNHHHGDCISMWYYRGGNMTGGNHHHGDCISMWYYCGGNSVSGTITTVIALACGTIAVVTV
jgi:hypothetical protein